MPFPKLLSDKPLDGNEPLYESQEKLAQSIFSMIDEGDPIPILITGDWGVGGLPPLFWTA